MTRREFIALLSLASCVEKPIVPDKKMKASRFFATAISTPVNAGRQFLIDNARAFWDFNSTGAVSTVSDLTGNGKNLSTSTGVFSYSFDFFEYRFLNNTTRNMMRTYNYAAFIPGSNGSLFQNDHEFHVVMGGRRFGTMGLLGMIGFAANQNYGLTYINGKLRWTLNFGSTDTIIETTNTVYQNTSGRTMWPITYVRWRVDFTNDLFRVWINGGEVATTFVSGTAISSWNPTSFIGTNPFGFGGYNNASNTSLGNSTYYSDYFYAAITDRLTDDQAYSVGQYFLS